MPQQRDLAGNCLIHLIAVRRNRHAGIAQLHQFGDAVAVIDHAFAPHLGGVRSEHRGNQRAFQQRQCGRCIDAVGAQPGKCGGNIGTRFSRDALAILCQIGEHRKQHEAAREIQRFIQAKPVKRHIGRAMIPQPPVPLHRSLADRLHPFKQRRAAIIADHIAQQFAEKADVRIIGDRGEAGHAPMLRCGAGRVNRRSRKNCCPVPLICGTNPGSCQRYCCRAHGD